MNMTHNTIRARYCADDADAAAMPPAHAIGTRGLNLIRRSLGLLAGMVALASLGSTARGQTASALDDLSRQNGAQQIQALMADKDSRTKAQQKLDSQLIYAARESATGRILPAAPRLQHGLKPETDGRIKVNIRGTVSPDLLAAIQSAGGGVINSFPADHLVLAVLPLASLEPLAARADILFIGPTPKASHNSGSIDSQGDTTHRAIQARANSGANGAGIRVGVLSDSIDNGSGAFAAAAASGDIDFTNTFVLSGQAGTGEGEGLAMCEIVHDLAPQASLYFATGDPTEQQMATNILTMAQFGCRVIIDDLTYNDESPFQDGPIAQAVNAVSAQGVAYFSSARNSGSQDSGISSTWEGDFADGGTWGGLWNGTNRSGRLLAFASGVVENAIIPGGLGSYRADLFWSDPLGHATNDYDLYMLDSGGNVVYASNTAQNGTQDPYEHIDDLANYGPGYFMVVTLHSGTGRFLHLDCGRGHLSTSTAGCTRGHNASGATNAFCVAATPAAAAFYLPNSPIGPFPNPFTSTNKLEVFSSDGPRRIFFQPDGSAITPGNFSSTGGQVLQKPDFTAADGVSTTLATNSGLNPFFGTSAAAPHAGAIAALLLSARPTLTPAQLRTVLVNSAIDIGTAGWDRDSGAGIVMADAAMTALTTPPVVAVTSPANNGAVNVLTTISGTASDLGSGLLDNQIHFTLNNSGNFWSGTYWTNTVATDPSILLTANVANGVWTFTGVPTGSNQGQGIYYVSAFAQDNAGNVSQAQSGVTSTSFTISTTPPSVAITSPLNGIMITNQPGGNWFEGTASGNLGVPFGVSLFIRRNSDNLYWTGSGWGNVANGYISNAYNSGTHTWQSTGALPVPGSSLGNGVYDFIAIATDTAGNHQQVDSVVTVDFHPVYVFTAGSNFDGDPNNDNMRWDNPANWDVGQVPPADSIVVINGFTPDNTSLNSVSLHRLDLSNGTLTTHGMIITNLNVSGGTLSGGTITIPANGVFNWSGGIIAGTYNVPAGASVNLTGAGDKTLSGAILLNDGMVTWNGGNILASYGSAISNNAIFVMQSSGFLYGYTGGSPSPVFNNNGLLQKTTSNGATIISPDLGGGTWTFNQNGTIDVENGALSAQSQFNVNSGAVFAGPGETRVDAGTIFITGTNTIQAGATVEMAGGTWTGTNTFAGAGTLVWSGGTIQTTLNLQSNIALNLTGTAGKTLGVGGAPGFLRSTGSGTWTGSGTVNCANFSVMENDGTFVVQNDATFAGYNGGVATFVNNGTFRKTTATGTTLFQQELGGGSVAFNNNGTVDVQSGSLALGGGGTGANDTFSAAAGSGIDFYAGSFSFNGSQALLGGGTNRVNGAGVTFNNVSSTMSGGNTFEIASGAVGGTNTIAGTGTVKWSGGTIQATLLLQPDIALNITGDTGKTLGVGGDPGFLRSTGPGTWTGAGTVNCGNFSVLENDGTFTVQNDATFAGYNGGVATFVNNGTFRKTMATGTTLFQQELGGGTVAFNNNGTVDLQSGSLAINGGYALSGSPQLKLVLGGLNPGTQFSQETFGGTAALGGSLSVTLTNGFMPTNGQSFALANYPSSTGQFATTQFPPLPSSLRWQLTYSPTSLLLQVVPANVFQNSSLTNGNFQFAFTGQTGSSCLIEASSNLLDWSPLFTNTPFTGLLNYVDPQTPQFPNRYYRATIFP